MARSGGTTSGLGVAMQASDPEKKSEEVRLMFKLFDEDHDGVVTAEELRGVLQSLDEELWTDERVDKVVAAYDTSGDGELQFAEFWGWVCGHGGLDTDDFKPALLDQAVERDREIRQQNEEKAARARSLRETREEKEAENAKKAAERETGTRKTRAEYIKEQKSVGVSEAAARQMFNAGDEDNDGEMDAQERQWLANDTSASTSQIRKIFQADAGEVDAKGNLVVKEVNDDGMMAIVEAFNAWDQDGNGTISSDELTRVLSTLNPKMGTKTVEALAREIDLNKDGLIDITEFVAWLSGESAKKKKMKLKAKQEQSARVALALHKKRSEEARKAGQQVEFEQAMHKGLEAWIKKKKIKNACNTLLPGPGAKQMCTSCYDRHAWVCHGCGYLSYFEDCVNGCKSSDFGWTCISKCKKKGCGCKKKPEFWKKNGCTSVVDQLSLDVAHIIEAAA